MPQVNQGVPIQVYVPVDDGGTPVQSTIEFEVRFLPITMPANTSGSMVIDTLPVDTTNHWILMGYYLGSLNPVWDYRLIYTQTNNLAPDYCGQVSIWVGSNRQVHMTYSTSASGPLYNQTVFGRFVYAKIPQ